MVQTLIRLPFEGATTVMQGVGGSYSHTGTLHYSYDFDLDFGQQVLAAAAGRVVEMRETIVDGGAYSYAGDPSLGSSNIGNFVTLEHVINGRTFYSSYFHLQNGSVPLSIGSWVNEGEVLGAVGNTGARSGTHLHFSFGASQITWQAGEVANAQYSTSNISLAGDLRFVGYDSLSQLGAGSAVRGGSAFDLAANSGTDGMIPLYGTGSGSIALARDMDWFRVSVQAGKAYTLDLKAAAGSTLDTYLRLYDANGRLVGSDDDSGAGTNSMLSFTANATTHYFLSAGGYGGSTGSYLANFGPRAVSRSGTLGADSLTGGDGADTLFGSAGNDTLRGYGHTDYLSGDSGRDFLSGGAGADTVDGGTGTDTLYGGTGADRFVFQQGDGNDMLRDFQNGTDKMSLQGAGGFGALGFIAYSSGTWVDYGNGAVFVGGVARWQLDASDFLFS
jgi:Ca2+-binding RTX toxin-like protein